MDTSEEKKTPLSLKVRPELKRGIERMAKAERRSPGNLGELLLEWAFAQLEKVGDSLRLLESAPTSSEKQAAGHFRDSGEAALAQHGTKSKKK